MNIFSKLFESSDIGIDLGSANMRVCVFAVGAATKIGKSAAGNGIMDNDK